MRRGLVLGFFALLVFSGLLRAQELPLPRVVEPAPMPGPPMVVVEDKPAPPPPKLWCGSVELGLGGADGNSVNHKIRTGADFKRATDASILKGDFLYSFANANGTVSENRSLSNLRHEWLFGLSPWSPFVSGSAETDEFKEFDVRIAGHAGMAYSFWKTPDSLLKGRLGFGGSREFGGTDDTFHPEALFGFDAEHRFSKRHKITAAIDYFPNVLHFSDYRIVGKVTYDLLIDPDWNLTLRLGVLDRYDSTPQSAKPNDIEYFATLLWKF